MSRPRRSEHVREALIQAGIEQLSVHGYHGTGIKQILDEVGVAKGSFYNFFDSKEAFVAELIGEYSQIWLQQLKQFISENDESTSAVHQLRFIYRYSLDQYKQADFKKSCLVGSMAAEISSESHMCRLELERAGKQWHAFFTSVFDRGQQEGDIRDDMSASLIAGVYWATWEGALIKMKMAADNKPALIIMDAMLATLLKPSEAVTTIS